MRTYVYPADEHGCGYHRLIWAGTYLGEQGHDVTVVMPGQRAIHVDMRGQTPVGIRMPEDCDVAVFQRVTNRFMAAVIPLIRKRGIAVVIDIDDDLTSIDPRNPAWHALHPSNEGKLAPDGQMHWHSWHHLTEACKEATLVTVSAPALLDKYARHGRGHVIYNHLADHYYGLDHTDSDVIGWPAALNSHPGDPDAVGNAVARLVNVEGAGFIVTAHPDGVGRAFGLSEDPPGITEMTSIYGWPEAINRIGVGICPLADTVFNQSKSWLKPLELSAVGVPWVGSNLPEYVRLHGEGAGGIIARTPKEWYRGLRSLVRDPERREDYRQAGYEVASRFRLRDNAWKWMEAWTFAYEIEQSWKLSPMR